MLCALREFLYRYAVVFTPCNAARRPAHKVDTKGRDKASVVPGVSELQAPARSSPRNFAISEEKAGA